MKKNLKFVIAAIAAIAMIGCTKDGIEGGKKAKEGVPTNAVIKIALPGQSHRAEYDAIVAPGESTIVDAWVFIFNQNTGRLTQKAPLTVSGGAVTATTVTTTTGPKFVFVAINAGQNGIDFTNDTNFPVDFVDAVTPANSTTGMMLNAFMASEFFDLEAELPAVSGKFLMTGYTEAVNFKAPTAGNLNPTENNITIGVGRAVAKVFMNDRPNVSALQATLGITFETLKFKVMNNPKAMYAFQKWSQAETSSTPFGEIKNRAPYDTANGDNRSLYYRTLTDYTPAGVATPTETLSAGLYVPENWPDGVSYARNATSLLIEGKVTFANKALVVAGDGAALGTAYVDGGDFYRVYDKTKKEWLTPYFGEANISMAYVRGLAGITSSAETSAWSLKKNNPTNEQVEVSPGVFKTADREFFVAKYTAAKCYWTLALFNPEQNNRHVVARNDAFKVTIATIKGIGASHEGDDDDDDGVIPENPPIDEVEVDVIVDIDMLKWHGIEQEGNI